MSGKYSAPRSLGILTSKKLCEACDYQHKYKACQCVVKCVDKEYISLCVGGNTCNHEISLFNQPFNLQEVRLYCPSLHKFGSGSSSDAEVVLVHGGNGETLLVCIPVKVSGSSNQWFDFLQSMKSWQCNGNQSINTGGSWSLENILPPQNTTGYFYYDASTYPWPSSDGQQTTGTVTHYIVYDQTAAAKISGSNLGILKKLITHNIQPVQGDSPIYAYNSAGNIAGGEYYLDCQSVGGDSPEEKKILTEKDDKESMIGVIVIGSLFGILLVYILWTAGGGGFTRAAKAVKSAPGRALAAARGWVSSSKAPTS